MPIERLRARHSSPEERADLESALKDPERLRFEDRRTFVLGMIGLAWVALLAEIGVMLECKKCPWKYEDALQLFEGFVTRPRHRCVRRQRFGPTATGPARNATTLHITQSTGRHSSIVPSSLWLRSRTVTRKRCLIFPGPPTTKATSQSV